MYKREKKGREELARRLGKSQGDDLVEEEVEDDIGKVGVAAVAEPSVLLFLCRSHCVSLPTLVEIVEEMDGDALAQPSEEGGMTALMILLNGKMGPRDKEGGAENLMHVMLGKMGEKGLTHRDDEGRGTVHHAARSDIPSAVSSLSPLLAEEEWGSVDKTGKTVLHYFLFNSVTGPESESQLEELLSLVPESVFSSVCKWSGIPLQLAIGKGRKNAALEFLPRTPPALLVTVAAAGSSPLVDSIRMGLDFFLLVLDRVEEDLQETPRTIRMMMYAAGCCPGHEVLEFLVTEYGESHMTERDGGAQLCEAVVKYGTVEDIKWLLEVSPGIVAATKYGQSVLEVLLVTSPVREAAAPLFVDAMLQLPQERLEYLMQVVGNSLFLNAVPTDMFPCLMPLVTRCPDVIAVTNRCGNLLHWAIQHSRWDNLRLMIPLAPREVLTQRGNNHLTAYEFAQNQNAPQAVLGMLLCSPKRANC